MKLLTLYFLLLSSIALSQIANTEQSSTWKQILEDKQGTIICYWYDTEPFIYEDNNGMKGIEYDLMNSFINYLENKYRIKISIKWVKTEAFNQVFNTVRKLKSPAFGLTAISFTEERSRSVEYTPFYMDDISVIVSGRHIPHANSKKEFDLLFANLNAITIQESTLEKMLTDLRAVNQLNFTINYTSKMGSLIDEVIASDNSFAYVDLPTYLLALEKNKPVRRQYFHAVKLYGYAFIYPKSADWSIPVSDYFNSDQFSFDISSLLYKHLGGEVVSLIEDLSNAEKIGSNEENMILSKEKDLQNQEMLEIMMKSEQRKTTRNLFFVGLVFLLLVALLIYSRYLIKVKSNGRLVELNREKSNLMRIVSHDIRNPVNQIVGLANLVKMEGNYLKKDHLEMINKIIEGGDRVNKMARKILDVEALEANRTNIAIETINLAQLLKEVIDSFKSRALNKRITIKSKLAKELNEVSGDKTYLTQVFENLISNALKFSEPERIISVEAINLAAVVETRVKDQGPGIAPEEMHKLFQKFQKLSAQPTDGEVSIGLGLSIVKRYVEAMNGTISCESEFGEGATFIVRLKKV